MSDRQQDAGKAQTDHDTEDALQEELRREAAEGRNDIGDIGTNRNLGGSSTWDTLPDNEPASDATDPGSAPGAT